MSHRINKVEYIEGYKLKLLFDDKKIKIVDLSEMLKDAQDWLAPLIEIGYFKKVECDGIAIAWPNGVDLCPDVLYSMGKDADKPTKKRVKKTVTKSKVRTKPKLKVVQN